MRRQKHKLNCQIQVMVYTELWHNKTCSSSRFTAWISDTTAEKMVGRGAERVRTGKPANGG